jgi:2,4-dienoyl-CoA reductase-like NADH-dependent reductase (Old Yellow Enzyme family)
MRVFEPAMIGTVELKNRILRSATFEGMCDRDGNPGAAYAGLYARLSAQGLGALITGFAYFSQDGKAMQPGQAGIDADGKVAAFSRVTQVVHENGCRIFLQVAHAGRQTVPTATGGRIYAPSSKKSPYFNHRPCRLVEAQIERIIHGFAEAARRARAAGFDGVQLHAAHGYLIHQFLNPSVNDRTDAYGIDPYRGIGTAFLDQVIDRIRSSCGPNYPLLIKVSAGDNDRRCMREQEFIHLMQFLDSKNLAAVEISFGTMDHALNIFRGQTIPLKTILDYNARYGTRSAWKRWVWKTFLLPLLKRSLMPFTPMYNLGPARLAKRLATMPIICVGGFRSGSHIHSAIEEQGIDFVSLCRPILCEPDFVLKVRQDERYESRCRNCNRCAIMCDSGFPTRCYAPGTALPAASDPPESRGVPHVIRSPCNQKVSL